MHSCDAAGRMSMWLWHARYINVFESFMSHRIMAPTHHPTVARVTENAQEVRALGVGQGTS